MLILIAFFLECNRLWEVPEYRLDEVPRRGVVRRSATGLPSSRECGSAASDRLCRAPQAARR